MRNFIRSVLACAAVLVVAGCLVSPVSTSGGIGAVTVRNSNPNSIIAALQNEFSQNGYTLFDSNYPDSVSFDKPAGAFGNAMWGSYGAPQSIRVKISIVPIPGTTNYRLEPRVSAVTDAGEAGFDQERPLMGLWSAEFGPLLKRAAGQASF